MKIKRLNESIPLSYDKRRLNNLERIRQESEARKIYNNSKREEELGVREWNPKLGDRISNISYDRAKYELFNAPVGTIIQISNHNLGDYIGEYTRTKNGWVGSQKYRSNRTKPASVNTPDGFAMQVVGDDAKVIAIGNIDESLNESTSSNQFVKRLRDAFQDVYKSLANLSEVFNAFEDNGFEDCNNYICDNYPFDCDFEMDLPNKILDWEDSILENIGIDKDDNDDDEKFIEDDYDLIEQNGLLGLYDSMTDTLVFNIEDLVKHKRGIKKFIHDSSEKWLLTRIPIEDFGGIIEDCPDGYVYSLMLQGHIDFNDSNIEIVDITEAIEEYENKK